MPFEYHPASMAAETTDYQAGTLSRITSAITKGAPSAAISGSLSIYNTFLDYAGKDQVETEDAVRRFGGDDMGDYYAESKDAIDLVGFIGTALIPGSIGIKGLKLARAGVTTGNFGKYLNLTSSKKAQYLEQALQETAQSGGVVKNLLSQNRLKYTGWEMADQAIMGTAFELAVVATMHDSPVFDDNSIGDLAWNVALGTGLSGVIGGTFGSLAARGILKSAQREIQTAARLNEALVDTQRMGLSKGTDALFMAESILNLPTQFDNIAFTYKLDGVAVKTELETAGALSRIRVNAENLGKDKLALKFNELANGDERIGQAYFSFLQDAVGASKQLGLAPTEIVQKINGYLSNLASVSRLDLAQIALDKRKFYLNLSIEAAEDATPAGRVASLFSPTRTRNTGKNPFRLADDVTDQDIVLTKLEDLPEITLKDAFKNNPQLDVIQLADGTLRVNPKSSRVLRVKDNPVQVKQLIDLETGSITNETAAVIGDILQKGKLTIQADGVYINGQRYAQAGSKAATMADSPLESSARWAWASQMDAVMFRKVAADGIGATDFPMMTRLVELHESKLITDTQLQAIRLSDDAGDIEWDDIASLRGLLDDKRLEWLEFEYANWAEAMGSVPDVRVLAAHLNTDYRWIEGAIERGYARPTQGAQDAGKILTTVDSLKPRTVQATWDFGIAPLMLPEQAYKINMGPSHLVTQELTKEYQRFVRRNVNENAATQVLAEDAGQFRPADELLSLDSSLQGAGATLFGAANAGYGERARLWVQNTGKSVAQATQRRIDNTMLTLAPSINALRANPRAAAELGIVTNMLRKSQHRYVFDVEIPNRMVSEEVMRLVRSQKINIDEALTQLDDVPGSPHQITVSEASTAKFLQDSANINHQRQQRFTTLYNASGLVRRVSESAIVYAPPINTVKYPFHAFVKSKQKIGLSSDVGMLTARTAEELRTKAGELGEDFDVFFKADTDNYFKIKGEYDYGSTLNEAGINSELARRGKLADLTPETRFENINEDWLQFHSRQEEKLVREAVQVQSREFFSEMRNLSDQYRRVDESVTRGIGSRFKSKVADPFGDFTKTALNISKQQEFPLLDSLNEFVDKVGMAAGDAVNKGFRDAKAGLISWEDANKMMEAKGLGRMYQNEAEYVVNNERFPSNLVKKAFQKVNMALATTMLRFDFANSIVNIISTPILLGTEMASIRGMLKNDPAAAGKLQELMSVALPGGEGIRVPSTSKLIGEAINNFFGKDKSALINRYKDMGAMKTVTDLYHEMLDMASYNPRLPISKFSEQADAAIETAAKISGNTFSEDFTRFISADVMRQLSQPVVDAGKMTLKEQDAYISTFVNRVQGNYVTSQRPVIFQGTTGVAVSLFQTYAFNVLQQLFRHMERGDKRTLAIFAGLQGSMFGMNGLPFFDAANTYLLGKMVAENPEHKDAYSVLPEFNKELGDWMLYGTASAFPLFSGSSPAFFTRGDINPRHMLILPTAIIDVPAVSASIKLAKSLYDTGKNIGGGADVSDALLQGLQHQGWNRPLAGFAQLMAGQSTNSKGSLISAASDYQTTTALGAFAERAISLEGASRLMGARPMNEAVALTALYRNKAYQAMDRSRIERLGTIVKTKLYNNETPTSEELDDFMLRYARSGGRVENFSQAMQRWSRDANVSVINQMAGRLNSPYSQKMQSIMGGDSVGDFRNQDLMAPDSMQYGE